MIGARLFIRDDDVWTRDKKFRFFFDLAIDHNLPVVYAAIPGKMDKGLIRFLCRAKEKTPQLLDIVQHGWVHANHSLDKRTKYEFGPSRDYGSQHMDIKQGQRKMRQAFGEYFVPAFVPPYHGYDKCTLQVLDEEGFRIFSARMRQAEIKKRFIEMPAQVSFSRYDQGRTSIHNARDVVGILARGIERRPLSGVVTHHAEFITAANRQELVRFFNLIGALRDRKEWRVLLFSDLWGK
jgi:hypothetical protein